MPNPNVGLFSANAATCSGRIINADGEGLPGAPIQFYGTRNGTSTDIDGYYTFTSSDYCQTGKYIVVSYTGFVPQKILITPQNMTGQTIYMPQADWNVERCLNKYYANWANGTGTCTRCPASGSIVANSRIHSDPYEYSDVTDCYIPANTEYSDTSGTYQYTAACYYTE
ncbi:carboxypeptidase-like regulatory domain-containing protein [bacterium]|nr:carboxypeptidase-like regulatory domain-containing protein [bacterium]